MAERGLSCIRSSWAIFAWSYIKYYSKYESKYEKKLI